MATRWICADCGHAQSEHDGTGCQHAPACSCEVIGEEPDIIAALVYIEQCAQCGGKLRDYRCRDCGETYEDYRK